ncbi:phospholipase A [Pusillimonas sp. MFBS29]|uniref:phospholipase A n=1 Tax=Pusillimonas sp. MFBS29 TaxID=2886690 RepID=UPI001D116187|nr:phospholipase A [Pusillimonas sp. MFBS29]MCC2596634.1 phospholipase A [Pusillimonas sp. MFBS29]
MAYLFRQVRIIKVCVALLGTLLLCATATAGISYRLQQTHAVPGETVNVRAVLFNDTDSVMSWTAPGNLVLQWRNESGQTIRSLAYLEGAPAAISIPVNNFIKLSWRAVVPTEAQGLQAVNIEGDATLLALDTSPRENSLIAGTPAAVPVIDAGAAGSGSLSDPPLPDNVVAATGASVEQGPAVNSTRQLASTSSSPAFDRFRNAISAYEPIYFDFGTKNGKNARYQISFKYRLFTPDDPENPEFLDHLYLGYTQTALWDLDSDSYPFVDTSFKPSLFWRKDALWQSPSKNWFVGLASGIQHESNGKSDEDSRSVNYGYIQPELNYRFDGGSTLTFAPRIKGYFGGGDHNPDYRDYAGNVDWQLRYAQDNGLVLTGLYRHGSSGHNMTQIEAAWPLKRTFLNMNGYLHVQYFEGYGETLLGYNQRSDGQVRVGIALVP